MIIRVESGLTLEIKGRHYVKTNVALEVDHPEVDALAKTLIPLAGDPPTEKEDIQTLYAYLFDAVAEAVWSEIEQQIDALEDR